MAATTTAPAKSIRTFPCRIEELPAISQFIFDAFQRDMADFAPYTDFTDPFSTDFQNALGALNELVNPVQFTNEMKVITLRLYTNMQGLRNRMNILENYVNNAGSTLTIMVKDFGISRVRKFISKFDAEGLDGALKTLEQNITNNFAALTAKGYTEAQQTALVTTHAQIVDDNRTQNIMISTRSAQTAGNMELMNEVYANFVAKTANQGKRIYKGVNPGKVTDYTISAQLRRIRQQQIKTSVSGIVKDALSNPANKAKVLAKPVAGGRTKTTTTKTNGLYSLKGLAPTAYNLIVTFGNQSKVQQITVNTGDHLTVDIVVGNDV